MNKEILEKLEEEYTCGSCIYLACALARRYSTNLSVFLYYEANNGEIYDLSEYDNFNEIPTDKYKGLIIDHVYARKNDLFYDVYGKTKKPNPLGEFRAKLFEIKETDFYKITHLNELDLNEYVNLAFNDIDKFLHERFKSLENNIKIKLKI